MKSSGRPIPGIIRCFVANINAPRQIAISGSIEAMEKALELARHRGARKAVRLGVSVPSHCPLLEPVADSLRAALAGMDLEEPRITYIGNITGRALRDAKTIAADITGNVAPRFGGTKAPWC